MPTLNITVRNKVAVGDKQVIVCDNTDYLVHFDLDSEWQAFPVKTMRVLYADGTYEETIFTGSDCSLPRIYQAQSIKIGIYAGDLHSTVAATFACKESIIVEGEQHVQPPEDVYLQILNLIESGAVRGNGIASIEKTGTAGNVDTYTITYDDGTTTTFEVTNGAVTSVDGMTGDVVLDNKANIDGSYDGMTVGSAQQLLASSGVEDKAPYAYRTSGGSMDIGDREELNEIDGMTVAWNQLVDTATSSVTVQSGHKYYAVIGDTKSIAQSNGTALAVTGGTDNVFDLTAMFGATIADYVYSIEQAQAGAGVAWFRALFPNSFYAYSAPTLMSVKTSGHKTVGFNQLDADTVMPSLNFTRQNDGSWYSANGYYNTGTIWTNDTGYSGRINFAAKVKYSSTSQRGTIFRFIYTDGTTSYIYPLMRTDFADNSFLSTSGKTVSRITSSYATQNIGAWFKDICISLYWSGTRNGEYEAYVEHTYPLDSTLELRGIPKLDSNNKLYADGDIYAPSGDVTRRYGIVDLGSLTWSMSTVTEHNRFQANNLHALVKVATDNIICPKYLLSSTHSANFVADKVIATSGSTQDNGRLWIWDDDYSTAADFKAAMSGVYLVYELATPTTETADPYQQTQVVNDFGTEEFIDSRDIAIPVGHKTTYLPNLRDKLQHLPSLASDDGYYVIRQQNNTMSLELFRIPKAPSEDGTYQLKATVTGGTPTYTWEAIV